MIINREKKERVRLGFIGCGGRGAREKYGTLPGSYARFPDVDIVWLCDINEKKLVAAEKHLTEAGRPAAKLTTDYRDVVADPEVDAVVVYTGWPQHVEIALAAMKAGKYVGIEVGCAYDISECYELVKVYEETGSPLMMLENDCYARRHLMAINMERMGVLGEVVHCTGAYSHQLSAGDLFKWKDSKTDQRDVSESGITKGVEGAVYDMDHYRQYEYLYRNAETYPTHEFGPISKLLRINRGNRCVSISSFGTKSVGIADFLNRYAPDDHPLKGKKFKQSDVVTSVITCAGGETVRLTLNTTLPIPYKSGDWSVRGTLGCILEEGLESSGAATIYIEGMPEPVVNNIDTEGSKYEHPIWAEGVDVEAGHGGIDWLTNRAFIEAVKNGTDTPIDAYDTATWMAIGPLSEMSIAQGGAPVTFPDFTNGKWFRREPVVRSKYCLDEVVVDNEIRNDLSHLKKKTRKPTRSKKK